MLDDCVSVLLEKYLKTRVKVLVIVQILKDLVSDELYKVGVEFVVHGQEKTVQTAEFDEKIVLGLVKVQYQGDAVD